MINLFSLGENWDVVIRPEVLVLKPFKKVMSKYKIKKYGLAELSYIYFMVDFRSTYLDIVDEKRRTSTVLENIVDSDKIIINKITKDAIEFYEREQPSMSHKHLKSMKRALVNLQESLSNINLSIEMKNPVTEELEPVYNTMDLNRITTIIKDSPKLISAIKEMEKQVKTELQENTTHVGSGEKSIYEDG